MKKRYGSYEKRKVEKMSDWVILRLRTEQELARGRVWATNTYMTWGTVCILAGKSRKFSQTYL